MMGFSPKHSFFLALIGMLLGLAVALALPAMGLAELGSTLLVWLLGASIVTILALDSPSSR